MCTCSYFWPEGQPQVLQGPMQHKYSQGNLARRPATHSDKRQEPKVNGTCCKAQHHPEVGGGKVVTTNCFQEVHFRSNGHRSRHTSPGVQAAPASWWVMSFLRRQLIHLLPQHGVQFREIGKSSIHLKTSLVWPLCGRLLTGLIVWCTLSEWFVLFFSSHKYVV